ncbi:scyllo-inositol 2-dehydrogenase (NAD(+)) [Halomicronema hongdechloris C2206]|uniref:Scyllo-inositol 2-dehydrogenase (NAD(+)) n=1 Tax=Halomicronema hongdechloris C2206 TaxID=1641165 RepID=A0A1Z3HHD0_9CYAN|nr:Gfo/Idh/MocA family oxidoreductase [Halomicronema hongdechloris]ASC69696.1 scyllo-inositol 2-dehydrogenase (NAD(+)) [Halomicronema hongdechloris C2206]
MILKLVLLGVGRWGHHLLRNLLNLPQVEVAAVADHDPQRLKTVQQTFALPPSTHLLSSWPEALALPGIEAVVVATPAVTHYPLIRAALERGLHVLAEKPLTLEVSTCKILCQLARQRQRQLIVDHTYLFHPAVQQGHQFLQQAPLGSLRYGYASRTNLGPIRHDVNALWDLAIHDIAIFSHWLQEWPMQVTAQGRTWLPQFSSQDPAKPLYDLVWCTLIYPSQFQVTLHLSWLNPDKQRRLCVVGERGTLVFDESNATPLVVNWGQLQATDAGNWIPQGLHHQVLPLSPAEPLHNVCRHFLDQVELSTPSPISSGTLATKLVRVLAALSQSLAQGGQIIPLTEATE